MLSALASALVKVARQALDAKGGYWPFAGVVGDDGEAVLLGADELGEETPTAEVLASVYDLVRQRIAEGSVVALAVCTDVRIPRPGGEGTTDAIRVALEHREDDPIDVFVPWERSSSDPTADIRFGEMFATPGDRRLFDAPAN